MKYIKLFENFDDNSFNIDDAYEWLMDNYNDNKIAELFDEEVASGNWTDSDIMEEEGYESEYDYYKDYGRGEAEDAIVDQIINHYRVYKEIPIGGDDYLEFNDKIRDEFDILNYTS